MVLVACFKTLKQLTKNRQRYPRDKLENTRGLGFVEEYTELTLSPPPAAPRIQPSRRQAVSEILRMHPAEAKKTMERGCTTWTRLLRNAAHGWQEKTAKGKKACSTAKLLELTLKFRNLGSRGQKQQNNFPWVIQGIHQLECSYETQLATFIVLYVVSSGTLSCTPDSGCMGSHLALLRIFLPRGSHAQT